MKFHRSLIIAAALTPIVSLATAATPALAREKSQKTSRVAGTVLKVDRATRTFVVRQSGTDALTTVYVPADRLVALSPNGNVPTESSVIAFERLHVGTRVNMEVEPASGNIALTQLK